MKTSHIIRILALALPWLVSAAVAAPDLRVVGLFSDRAVLEIDGRRTLLRVGETAPGGIQLMAANSDAAELLVNGERTVVRLDGRVTARRREASVAEVQVRRNNHGMYTTVGSINGLPVPFMVDTGATLVAINAAQARRLGIDFRVTGTRNAVTTASGTAPAWLVTLDRVKVGALELRNVAAVILEGAQPETALLGMSYLGRLEIFNSGELMTLRKKY